MIILGANGFIGSHLEDNGQPPVVNCVGVQPARGEWDLWNYLDINVMRLETKLEVAKRHGLPFITLCSQKTTLKGEIGKLVLTDNAARNLCEWYHQTYGLRTIVLSLPPVYGIGPYLKGSGLGAMMDAAKAGKPIEVWGDHRVRRDFISIHDVVSAINTLAESEAQGEYQISGGLLSVEAEAEIVNEVFGGVGLTYVDSDNGLESSCVFEDMNMSSGRPKLSELGWRPEWDFRRIVMELKGGVDAT
jgi:UDP-glucose 4-epimerase